MLSTRNFVLYEIFALNLKNKLILLFINLYLLSGCYFNYALGVECQEIMFSGIHSLLFRKKQKVKSDDSTEEAQQQEGDNDEFVFLERRHSGDFDHNSALYPSLNPSEPSSSNFPNVVSPSLPNLNDATSDNSIKKEDKVDMLHAVPFVLSPEILLLSENSNKKLTTIVAALSDVKESGEEHFLDQFSYDFELEHSVSTDY